MTKMIVLLLLAVLAALTWPLALIWSVNLLFNLSIPYSFLTWMATFLITVTFGRVGTNYKQDS